MLEIAIATRYPIGMMKFTERPKFTQPPSNNNPTCAVQAKRWQPAAQAAFHDSATNVMHEWMAVSAGKHGPKKHLLTTLALTMVWAACLIGRAHGEAHWIAAAADRQEKPATFQTQFTLSQPVVSATLRCVGESMGLQLALDERLLLDLEPYDPMASIDVTTSLRPGNHTIVITTTPCSGPSAFMLQLEIESVDGSVRRIYSSRDWRVLGAEGRASSAVSFGQVDPRLLIDKTWRVGINAVDNYEQWKQALSTDEGTDPTSFLLAPGFAIDRVRSALPDEDSWVSLIADPKGRLIVAKESEGLLRMTLSEDGTKVTRTELIESKLKECRGLAFVGNDLYVNANNSKGLYRLRAVDEDRFAEPELVFASSGGVGHGRNDLAVGPDGMLYSIHGDAVELPQDAVDYTSPFREARKGQPSNEGHLLRIDPRSGDAEVLAAGLRNPFGIDFNPNGDIFTYDADAEHDMGAPWYRPTRVSHLVVGGDYGWRGVTGTWPPYYPDHADNARANLDLGKGSPTAIKFGTTSNFPQRYRDAMFILDWAYGRIIAVHCIPCGSSYRMTAETFLKGQPLNVTDLEFTADGSMYFVTGGRKTQSALYRIRSTQQKHDNSPPATLQQKARLEFANGSRQLRRALEAQLRQPDAPVDVDHTLRLLADPDPWIAAAAVRLLEATALADWQERALRVDDHRIAVAAILSLARSGATGLRPRLLDRLNALSLTNATRTEKLQALQAYHLLVDPEWIREQPERVAQSRQTLGEVFPDSSPEVNRLLSELLVRLQADDVVAKTMALLAASTEQPDQLHYLFVLRGVRNGWTLDQRRAYFRALSQSKDYRSGAGMPTFLDKIRSEAVATLTREEHESLADLLLEAGDEEDARLEELSEPRSFIRQWTVEDVLTGPNDGPRDLERGRKMFSVANCIKCHRIGTQGRLIGPDLTAASRRFSERDLLVSIIQPSLVIPENYRSVQIVTDDGATYTGQAILAGDYRSPQLRLASDPTRPSQYIEIDKSAIAIQKLSDVSWMPTGLLDTLTREEILDLLAYIESAAMTIR